MSSLAGFIYCNLFNQLWAVLLTKSTLPSWHYLQYLHILDILPRRVCDKVYRRLNKKEGETGLVLIMLRYKIKERSKIITVTYLKALNIV